jgi:hypothetical protein
MDHAIRQQHAAFADFVEKVAEQRTVLAHVLLTNVGMVEDDVMEGHGLRERWRHIWWLKVACVNAVKDNAASVGYPLDKARALGALALQLPSRSCGAGKLPWHI